jgi:hypothetical protein
LSSDDFRGAGSRGTQRLKRLRNGVFALGANRLLDGVELFPLGTALAAKAGGVTVEMEGAGRSP